MQSSMIKMDTCISLGWGMRLLRTTWRKALMSSLFEASSSLRDWGLFCLRWYAVFFSRQQSTL